MGQSLTPGLQVKRSTIVRRIRELPVPGKILKNVGDRVSSEDIVARADLVGELYIVRIAEQMGIEPDEVMKGLEVRVGDTIREKDVVCVHTGLFGLFKTRAASPVGGVLEIVTATTGHIGIRLPPEPITLDAYLDGVVVEVSEGKSVTIESRAALIQGIFGIGGERRGTLELLDVKPGEALTPAHIPENAAGKVLVGGTRPSIEVIRTAANAGAAGFITGAIDDRAMAEYLGYDLGIALTGDEEVPMTIIVTEGFGELSISPRVLQLFEELRGRRCSINGSTQVRAGALRPEILVSRDNDPALDLDRSVAAYLQPGSRIRVIRVPWFGAAGTVLDLPQALTRIATGAEARVLRARLDSGEEIVVPRANVELI